MTARNTELVKIVISWIIVLILIIVMTRSYYTQIEDKTTILDHELNELIDLEHDIHMQIGVRKLTRYRTLLKKKILHESK